MSPTLRSASGPVVGHIPSVPGSPSHLRTWLFDAETSDDSSSEAFSINPPSTTSTTSTKPGSELETIIDSECEFDCETPTPGVITTSTHEERAVTELETESNHDSELPNTPRPETPISDIGPEPELRGCYNPLPFGRYLQQVTSFSIVILLSRICTNNDS
ncbi:hypothetical protein B9Z19DRAFT_1123864 [Tuber borchii]|uniref:Uncharacterized protein n=1 Tax=Tuber borchii TaxID=42251 RepID=A0A2T6ZXU6_TUBBO|nr:hypothetical protein B9Z19DRAFT_1123864 [Tuber borchii]